MRTQIAAAVGVLGIGTICLANVDASAFSLAVPLLHRSFGEASVSELGLVQSAYGLGFAGAILPAGRIADRRGPRRLLIGGLMAFASASVLGATSPVLGLVIASRAIAAVGIATAVPGALTMLLTDADQATRRRRVGQWGAAGAVAAGCGPPLGGLLGQLVGWRGLFLLGALPAIVLVVVAWRMLTASPLDEASSLKPTTRGWLLRPGVLTATVASAAVGTAIYAVQIMTGLALVDQAGLSIGVSGLVLAPAFLLSGWFALKVGQRRTSGALSRTIAWAACCVLLAAGLGVVAALLDSPAIAVLAACVSVLGTAPAATCVSTAAALAAGSDVGRVTSLNQIARQAGGALGAAGLGLAIGHSATATSLRTGWTLIAAIAILIVLLGIPLGRDLHTLERVRRSRSDLLFGL